MLRYVNACLVYPLAERALGRNIRPKVSVIRRELRSEAAERLARRRRELVEVLQRAGCYVPYYRDVFRQQRFDPEKVARDVRYLNELPLLTKSILREQAQRLISDRYQPAALHVRQTGGSTGSKAIIYYSSAALDWTAAVNVASLEAIGKRRHQREVHLASRFPEKFPWRDRLKERVKCLALNRVNVFTDHLDAQGLQKIWRKIRRARPHLLQGHPSTMYALALHLRSRQVRSRGVLRIFESTGEVLDPKQRETIGDVFGCRLVDRYGNAEMGVVAYQTTNHSDHRLRLFDFVAWPETVPDESGQAELVLTGLLNDAMPLVRYQTGDLAELGQDQRGFYLTRIVGRVHDLVRIGEHIYPTHYIQDLLDRVGGIDLFQIEVRPGRPPLLRLVVENRALRPAIAARIASWWSGAVELEFVDVAGLVRQGWRSKFRYLVENNAAA